MAAARIALSTLPLLLLAMLAPAAADPRRATVEVKDVERRFTQPAPVPVPAASRGDARPAVSLPDFLQVRRGRLKQITDAQIAKMRALIVVVGPDDPEKPDLLFRLGELCAENQRFYFGQARELDQKIFEAAPDRRAPLRARQQGFERHEQAWLLEAVKAYVEAARHRTYRRMDEVLFRLAHVLTSVKKDDEAREFLLRLIKDHPTSRYIPDAYLSFAELYFDRGDMDAALRFYDKVAEFPASSVYPYAVYKKGWCHVNRGDFKAALETFVGVVRMTQNGAARVSRAQLDVLAREARKDIVTAYARVGGPDRAWDFFQRTGGDSAGKMMEALAERYWEQGQAPDSTRVYRKIIATNMASPRLCAWQAKILRNHLPGGSKRDQTQELERLGAVYERMPAQKPGEIAECRNSFHDAARELALVWHREGQKTREPETYRLAERAYRLFLTHFPDDQDAYEMSFYRGELLWVLERWQEAAEQYTKVVDMNTRGRYLREAAYAAVLAWKNTLGVGDGEAPPPERKDGDLAPRPIPEPQRKMIAAFHRYRTHVADAPEIPVMLYREGYIYYDHNQFERAAALFLEVVEKYTEHELAVYAAHLHVDALNALGKSAEVVAAARRFLEMAPLAKDAAFVISMVSLVSDGFEQEAREHDRRGNRKECGRSFLAAAEAQPAHRKHAERLWNAAQCFQNAHLVGQAIKTWQALIKGHPGDPLAQKALYRVGAGYHTVAYYSLAADSYEEYARKFPGEPRAATALANATIFREGLRQPAEALADMDAFIGFYGARKPDEAAGVYFQKAEIYEAQNQPDELRAHLRAYLEKWAKYGGVDRQVRAHFRLGELAWKASCAHPSADGACVQVTRATATRGAALVGAARRKLGKAARAQCGPATKSRIVLHDRDRRQAAEADAHLRAAIDLWRKIDAGGVGDAGNGSPIAGRDADARRAAAAHAAAGASFYLAEKAYEELLRVEFPKGLDFSRPSPLDGARRRAATARKLDESNQRLGAYLSEKAKRLEAARAQYLRVFQLRQAQWTIAAAARIAQLHQDFAGQLYTAEIPRDLPEVDPWGNRPRDLYCGALEDQAGKVEAQAVDGFRACLGAATRESWYNEWSALCERELNQLEPAQFPLSAEAKPEAVHAPITIAATPVSGLLTE